jgi:hypothetical protein
LSGRNSTYRLVQISGTGSGLSTEIDSWRHLQSDNIEFTIKRLREPIDADHGG